MIKKLLFFFLLTVHFINAQNTSFLNKTYTKQDGLKLDYVETMCYDNDGFLWLGGNKSNSRLIILSDKNIVLQRFNGKSFHSIELPYYKNKINAVTNIQKRKDGKFYINVRLENGFALFLFDPITIELKTIIKPNISQHEGISKITHYNNKDYVITQKNRDVILNTISKDLVVTPVFSFKSHENKYLVEINTIFFPYKDFCIISDNDISTTYLTWTGDVIKQEPIFTINGNPNKYKHLIDEYFIYNKNKYVFLMHKNQLHKVDTLKHAIKPLQNQFLNSAHLKTFNDEKGQVLTVASYEKIIRFNSFKNDKITPLFNLPIDRETPIKLASKDITENLWVATNGELQYYKFPKKTVKTYLNNLSIRAIASLDSLNYLVATESNGWFKLNTKTERVSPFVLKDSYGDITPNSSRNIIVEKDTIWSNNGYYIIKTDKKTKVTKSFKHFPVLCLNKINDSSIVYGTKGYNLMHFNTKTKTHKPLINTDSLDIYDLETRKNSVYAATNKGLLTYNLKTKAHHLYTSKDHLEDSFLLMVDYHKDYGIILGSRSGKVISFNPKTNQFKTLYEDNLNAGIATILFDKKLWWINTFNGIVAFNPEDKTTTRYSEKDGFSHYEANRYSALKTNNGLFVGTIKGLNYFNPEELHKEKNNATLALLKVRSYNNTTKEFKNTLNRSLFNDHYKITLPSENRTLEIDFGLKNCNAIDDNYTFRYRLNNDDWIDIKQQNTILFPNLSAGDFSLEIETKNFSGKTIGENLIINIESKEFFYKTWWFILLVTGSIITFLLLLLNASQKRKELQQQFSEDLMTSQEDERKRIAQELHDSINQQLTFIKKKAQNNNQDEISMLAHHTLEEIRSISRGLYPPLLKQLGLTESIEQLILEIDETTVMFVTIDVDNIDAYFNEAQTLNIYRFIQECVTNCVKHANANTLEVSLIKELKSVTIKIKDNGKGFDKFLALKNNSLGLKTIYERIRILNGDLQIDTFINKGTKIIATIPV